ncbi:MAG: hypothetical protein ACREH6_04335, partial [Geminicoccaceae bacterium]
RIQARRQLQRTRRPDDALKKGLHEPSYLRRPYDTGLAGGELPVGTGKAFILIQNTLRRSDERLRSGDVRGAARLLAGAAADLDGLKAKLGAALPPDEPNLLALESQLGALKERLEKQRDEG